MILPVGSGMLCVEIPAANIVHVTYAPKKTFSPRPSLMVAKKDWTPVTVITRERPDSVSLASPELEVLIDRADGKLTFRDLKGKPWLSENGRKLEPVKLSDQEPAWSIQQDFLLNDGDALYGLGQFQNGVMNWRGRQVLLRQVNTQIAIPMMLSSGGWGLLWDNASETEFKDGKQGMSLKSLAGDQEDYWFIAGRPDAVIAGYREITGAAPLFGKWAYGYWQSKEHYHTQQELLGVAAEFRKRGIPVDNLVQDWNYWDEKPQWSSMEWHRPRYPDPRGMVDTLHKQHYHLMISIWPTLGASSRLRREMAARGFLLKSPKEEPALYDAFNPQARELYWKFAEENLFSTGLDAWWMDASEPEIGADEFQKFTTFLGSGARVQNAFPLEHTRGVYEQQRAATDQKRVFILTRSAFAGMQRNAAAAWSGDISATWETLANEIPAGVNFCMAGLPYWTHDIGAFYATGSGPAGPAEFTQGCEGEAYREFYTRWFQFGAFSPLFRSHGTDTPREPWRFGQPGEAYYDTLLRFDNLRYRLLPYIYSLAWQVTHEGFTLMRGLAMDFPEDQASLGIKDQFMFGHEFLVNPVTWPMYTRVDKDASVIPTKNLFTPLGKKGLQAEYFLGNDFGKPARQGVDKQVDFDWGLGSPEGLPQDHFSARWTGKVLTEEAGEYQFCTVADDGTRLWVNGQLLIDDWTCHAATLRRASIKLKANTRYDLKLEYFENTEAASVKLMWTPPARKGVKKAVVPKERPVYLPPAVWVDFWTGETLKGGRNIRAKAPIDILPLYVKAGSLVLMGPFLEYSDEKPADPLELRIYPGADGSFLLYEDEGDGYGYEKGRYATIAFKWNDRKKILEIGPRQGAFPGMLKKRTFNVVLVKKGRGTGVDVEPRPDRTAVYQGEALSVSLK